MIYFFWEKGRELKKLLVKKSKVAGLSRRGLKNRAHFSAKTAVLTLTFNDIRRTVWIFLHNSSKGTSPGNRARVILGAIFFSDVDFYRIFRPG